MAGFLGMLLLDQLQHRVGGSHAHVHGHGRGALHLRNSDDDLEQAATTPPPRVAGKVRTISLYLASSLSRCPLHPTSCRRGCPKSILPGVDMAGCSEASFGLRRGSRTLPPGRSSGSWCTQRRMGSPWGPPACPPLRPCPSWWLSPWCCTRCSWDSPLCQTWPLPIFTAPKRCPGLPQLRVTLRASAMVPPLRKV